MSSPDNPVKEIRVAYDTVADSYAELLADTSHEAPIDLAMIRHFVDELAARRGLRMRDAGCGAGRMITHLESISGAETEIEGVDVSPRMIADLSRTPTGTASP